MTMDVAGIILVLVFGIGYLYLYKRPENVNAAKFCLFCAGIGAGMIIASFWALAVIDSIF